MYNRTASSFGKDAPHINLHSKIKALKSPNIGLPGPGFYKVKDPVHLANDKAKKSFVYKLPIKRVKNLPKLDEPGPGHYNPVKKTQGRDIRLYPAERNVQVTTIPKDPHPGPIYRVPSDFGYVPVTTRVVGIRERLGRNGKHSRSSVQITQNRKASLIQSQMAENPK